MAIARTHGTVRERERESSTSSKKNWRFICRIKNKYGKKNKRYIAL